MTSPVVTSCRQKCRKFSDWSGRPPTQVFCSYLACSRAVSTTKHCLTDVTVDSCYWNEAAVAAGDSAGPRVSHMTDVREGQQDTNIGRPWRVVEGYYFCVLFCRFYVLYILFINDSCSYYCSRGPRPYGDVTTMLFTTVRFTVVKKMIATVYGLWTGAINTPAVGSFSVLFSYRENHFNGLRLNF